jgi:hypothetical protein
MCNSSLCWRSLVLVLTTVVVANAAPTAFAAGPSIVGEGTPDSCTRAALSNALSVAPSGQTILFNCGENAHTILVVPTLGLAKDVTIDGGGRIALSGGNRNRVVDVRAFVKAELRNLTIRDGQESASPSSPPPPPPPGPLAPSVSVVGEAFAWGGGVLNGGTLTIKNSAIIANSAIAESSESSATALGGGIVNQSEGTLAIENSSIIGNMATASATRAVSSEGGGIANFGLLVIRNSTVRDNDAESAQSGFFGRAPSPARGGGISSSGTMTIENSILENNAARIEDTALNGSIAAEGGAIANTGTVTIKNSVFTGNTALATHPGGLASARGGAIFNDGPATISNSSITANIASVSGPLGNTLGEGGGIWNLAFLSLKNTNVALNEPDDCIGC